MNVNVNVIATDATTGATALLLNVCLCDFYIVTRRPTRKLLRDVNIEHRMQNIGDRTRAQVTGDNPNCDYRCDGKLF